MSNLKTFILQHEIITPGYENHVIKAGTIIRETLHITANGNVIFRADNGDIFTDTYVIDNPLWFKPEGITGTGETSTINTEPETQMSTHDNILQIDLNTLKYLWADIKDSSTSFETWYSELTSHTCKHCGAKTTQPDSECYKYPFAPNSISLHPKTTLDGEQIMKLVDMIHQFDKHNTVISEPEAVRFAKWVSPHTHIFGKGWYLPCENQQYFTTEELYSKFKQETK